MSVLRTPAPSVPYALALRLSLAAPEELRALSGGELTSPAGLDERGRPVPGGLFCPHAFGGGGEACACGPAGPSPGIICALCGLPGARFAHVELACPIAHPWFLRLRPSPVACLLGVSRRGLLRLVYGDGDAPAGEGEQTLPPPAASNPGEALAERLRRVDLGARVEALRGACEGAEGGALVHARRRLRAVEALRAGGVSPERMLVRVLPVLPPGRRPRSGGRRDLDRLYASIIEANLRLCAELGRGEGAAIVRARRALQRAADGLFWYGYGLARSAGEGSLVARAFGPRGALRARVAPRRVGLSAGAVVAPDPLLSPGECALPLALARELYRPLVLARLARGGAPAGVSPAGGGAAFDEALEALLDERPLLVARLRARTRAGLRAFWPRLTGGEVLGLAPLACASLGLEGGERVRLHVPLSGEACDDLAERMVWPAGASRPGTGEPPMPTRQARLGLAYATAEPRPAKGGLPADLAARVPAGRLSAAGRASLVAGALEGGLRGFYAGFDEVRRAYDAGELELHAAIVLRCGGAWSLTSAGRCLVGEGLDGVIAFDEIDRGLGEQALGELLRACRRRGGDSEAAAAVGRLERLGLEFATRAGLSLSADDLRPPPEKADAIARAHNAIFEMAARYEEGDFSGGEYYEKNLNLWYGVADEVSDLLMRELEGEGGPARQALGLLWRAGLVTKQQACHLAALRRPLEKRSSEAYKVYEAAVASLYDGASSHEYFFEAALGRTDAVERRARGRAADRLLSRLVACCADVVVEQEDCGAGAGPRSVLACRAAQGMCAACYGGPPGGGGFALIGDAVGVLAAQSVGEAARRLVGRVYHIGCGPRWRDDDDEYAKQFAKAPGYVRLHGALPSRRSDGTIVVVGRNAALALVDEAGRELSRTPLAQGSVLWVAEGQKVDRGQRFFDCTDWLVAEADGVVRYEGLVEGVSVVDRVTEPSSRYVYDVPAGVLDARVRVVDEASGLPRSTPDGSSDAVHVLSHGARLIALEGQRVQRGDLLATVSKPLPFLYWGNMPELLYFLEARVADRPAVLSDVAGVVSVDEQSDGGQRVTVTPLGPGAVPRDDEARSYRIERAHLCCTWPGERVRAGDELGAGPSDPHDLLRIHGPAWLGAHLVEKILSTFAASNEPIDPRHVGVIVRQMLRFVRVDDGGDTRHLPGDLVDRVELERENAAIARGFGRPAEARPALVGIADVPRLRGGWLGRSEAGVAELAYAALAGDSARLDGVCEALAAGLLAPLGTAHSANRGTVL